MMIYIMLVMLFMMMTMVMNMGVIMVMFEDFVCGNDSNEKVGQVWLIISTKRQGVTILYNCWNKQ